MSRYLRIPDRLLTTIEGHAYGAARYTASAIDRLETREQIDQRSDAELAMTDQFLADVLAGRIPVAVGIRIARLHLQRGVGLDQVEDEHVAAVVENVTVAHSEAQAIGGLCQRHLSPCGEGQHAA